MPITTAKLFQNGRSQAVRLPKDFRFEGDEVIISKEGKKVILEPQKKKQWGKDFWEIFTPEVDFPEIKVLPTTPFSLDE